MNDNKQVASNAHYDRVDVHAVAASDRVLLPTHGARSLNNWIKARQYALHVVRGDNVLDVCAGKGGDLHKMHASGVAAAVLVDSSRPSLDEARRRLTDTRSLNAFRTHVRCVVGDAFSPAFWRSGAVDRALRSAIAGHDDASGRVRVRARTSDLRFGAITCQFALHYAFSSETCVRSLLESIHRRLRSRGIFFGIVANGDRIVDRIEREGGPERIVRRPLFVIDASEDSTNTSYRFTMIDHSVVDVREYVVHERELRRMAAAENFECVYYVPLPDFTRSLLRRESTPADQRRRMESLMTDADPNVRDVLSLYAAFAFRRIENPRIDTPSIKRTRRT